MSERKDEKEEGEKKKNRAKEVNGLASTQTPWPATTSAPEEKAERITPYPHPDQSNSPSTPRRPMPPNFPTTPTPLISCTQILLLPGGGERHCPSPPARCSCTVRGSMLRVIIHEREEGRLSGDFHMNEDQHNTI